jgi:hypothetical protein
MVSDPTEIADEIGNLSAAEKTIAFDAVTDLMELADEWMGHNGPGSGAPDVAKAQAYDHVGRIIAAVFGFEVPDGE